VQTTDDPGTRKRPGRAEFLAVLGSDSFTAAGSELALADPEYVRVHSILDVGELEG
jgi:hypothetical protein